MKSLRNLQSRRRHRLRRRQNYRNLHPSRLQPEKPAVKPADPLRPKRHDQTLIEAAIDESELLTSTPRDIADESSTAFGSDSNDFVSSFTPDVVDKKKEDSFDANKPSQSVADRLAMAANKSLQEEKRISK